MDIISRGKLRRSPVFAPCATFCRVAASLVSPQFSTNHCTSSNPGPTRTQKPAFVPGFDALGNSFLNSLLFSRKIPSFYSHELGGIYHQDTPLQSPLNTKHWIKLSMQKKLEDLRDDASAIFQAGLDSVNPAAAVKRFCRLDGEIFSVHGCRYDLTLFSRIIVLGAGKAGASMAGAVEELLGDRITEGLVVVKYGHLENLSTVRIIEASHPVPDDNGLKGARALLQLAESGDEKTLFICLISGGGSALTPLPVAGVSLEDKQETTRALLGCGASIHEVNTIRKHLSRFKGGGLAKAAYPATVATLILSDVVGDDLDVIASGPCVPDPTTYANCLEIIVKYGLDATIPQSVMNHIAAGTRGRVEETPKQGDKIFRKTVNTIIGSNFEALQAAKKKADQLGYNTLLISSMIEGETKDAAAFHMAIAREVEANGHPIPTPACLLSGGETTVTLKGSGKGGRNQEFALAAALASSGMENFVVLSGGTDGTDGPTDAAGAVVDSSTLARAETAGLDPAKYLGDNDSYHFFDKLGDLYKTGPTNTNVMDVRILLVL